MSRTITLATNNIKKIVELQQMLGDKWLVKDTSSITPRPSWDETGTTFKENAKIKWNGKFTSGAKPCLTFNNGRDTHPRSCLLPDGACKFDHVCDHFLTGGGKCGSSAHGRNACNNPAKQSRQQ